MTHTTTSIPDMPALGRLAGRRIVVTGAGSGIGAAIARLFIAEGAKIAAIDQNAAGIHAYFQPGDGIALKADVSHEASVTLAIDSAAQALGGIDGLVNAAGIANGELLSEVSLEDWRRVIDVNLTGSFLLARACYPHLRKVQDSTIVNFSSGQGLQPFMRRVAEAVEIARAALYLTGGESSFITGVALAVDGGRSYH